jgi:hypothetical protein
VPWSRRDVVLKSREICDLRIQNDRSTTIACKKCASNVYASLREATCLGGWRRTLENPVSKEVPRVHRILFHGEPGPEMDSRLRRAGQPLSCPLSWPARTLASAIAHRFLGAGGCKPRLPSPIIQMHPPVWPVSGNAGARVHLGVVRQDVGDGTIRLALTPVPAPLGR